MGALRRVLVKAGCNGVILLTCGGALFASPQRGVERDAAGGVGSAPTVLANAAVVPRNSELPDSPGVIAAANRSADLSDQQSFVSENSSAPQNQTAPQSQQTPNQQTSAQKPVGTAAAEAPNSSGVAASEPAGVAIAPAKQRRVRTIVLRVGAIIGAGVAVGTVIALTEATSSKPPGAH